MLARYQKSRPKRWQGNLHVPEKKKNSACIYGISCNLEENPINANSGCCNQHISSCSSKNISVEYTYTHVHE